MSGPNFTNILSQLANILPTGNTATTNIRPNATLVNTSQIVVEALAASAKQGFVRGQVIRENRDESYTIRTKDGDVQIQPSTSEKSGAATSSSGAAQSSPPPPQFNSGDPIRLDFPIDSLSAGGTLELQVSLLNSAANLLAQDPLLTTRASETPLNIQVNAATQGHAIPAPISARLEHIPAEKIGELIAPSALNQIISTRLETPDITTKNISPTNNPKPENLIQTLQTPPSTLRTVLFEGEGRTESVSTQIVAPLTNNTSATTTPPTQVHSQFSLLSSHGVISTANPTIATRSTEGSPALSNVAGATQTTVSSNRFDILPQRTQLSSAPLVLPNNIQQGEQSGTQPLQQNNRAAAQITQSHHAGHSTATIVGFSRDGAPIVSLYSAQSDGQLNGQIPQQGTGQTSGAPSALSGDGESGELYLLRTALPLIGALNVGTQIEIVPQTQNALSTGTNAKTAESAAVANSTAFLLSPGHWPVMTELMQALNETSPALAQAMSNITPNAGHSAPTAQMMPAAMLFVAAMRGGDMQSWMGNRATDLLRSTGKADLVNRLSGEGSALGRVASEPLSQDWRAMPLPFLEQGEMQRVALYYKHEDQENDEGGNVKHTRFVFDMALSQMGKVQVDGLFRGQKLDLIVRTGDDLSADMRQRMRGAYHDALEVSGLSGELSFQNGEKSYFSVAPQMDEFQDTL